MNIKHLLISAASLFALASCSNRAATAAPEAGADTPATQLLHRLQALADKGVTAYGHHDDTVYGYEWFGDEGRSDVLETVGDHPAIINWDLGRIELEHANNIDSVPFDRMRREMRLHHERGGINSLSWHPMNPRYPGQDSWAPLDGDIVAAAVTTGTPENATFTRWLTLVTDYVKSLVDKDGNPLPLIMRPWHEMSGGWFWWGGPNTTVESYRKLWALTREAFDRAGLDTNILWAYSPDVVADKEQYLTWYPGDEYVDILGADVYHRDAHDGIDTWMHNVDTTYGAAAEVAREKGKIAALTETGCEALPVHDWYTRCMLPVIRKWHPAYITVWRNGSHWMKADHFYAPYPGHPGVESFKTFHADSATVFLRDIAAIR